MTLRRGDQLAQQLQPLRPQLGVQVADAGEVAARPGQAGDKSRRHRVDPPVERRSGSSSSLPWPPRTAAAHRAQSQRLDAEPDRRPTPAIVRFGPPPSETRLSRSGPRHSRFRADPSRSAAQLALVLSGRRAAEVTDHRHCRLLRARQADSAAAPPSKAMNSRRLHSITSSARPSSGSGTVMPSALAVLRLMIISTLVDLLDRQVGRLVALENAAGVAAGETKGVGRAGAVAHQAAGRGELGRLEDRGHAHGGRRARRAGRRGH